MKTSIKIAIITGVIFGLAFVLMGIPSKSSAGDPPTTVTIDKIKKSKPAITFHHGVHAKKDGFKCENCHADAAGGGELKLKAMGDFHAQCKDACHKDKGGPTKCEECHK